MRYLSMFSGIEAATVAWHPLDWEPVAFAEIEKFPSAVLAHHYPDVPNLGDVTKVDWDEFKRTNGPVDLVVFGSPCQSFSVAGRRLGLDDPRGNLALYALAVVDKLRPKWFVFENVPGLLSSGGGRDFGAFLGTVGECGYQCAWRVLDAQYFGVPQRRRRVFVVGHLGDWRAAAAVLFERHSLSGHPAPRRKAGQGADVCPTLRAGGNSTGGDRPPGTDVDTAGSLQVVAAGFRETGPGWWTEGLAGLRAQPGGMPTMLNGANTPDGHNARSGHTKDNYIVPVAFAHQAGGTQTTLGYDPEAGTAPTLSRCQTPAIAGSAVRRLTPRECERLQGFPDDYTLITWRGKPAADGPRYKALGNSMAVPVMRWIGSRIALMEALKAEAAA